MKEFSLILPTRERLHLVQKLFSSLVQTTKNLSALEIILFIDDDDHQSAAIEYPGLDIVKIIRPRKVTMGRITQICFEASRGRYIALVNDDMIIRTQGWDEKVRKEFLKYPDEVVMIYPDDHYYGKKMCTFPIVTRKTGELMEGICPAQYESHCIDAHIFDLFKRLMQKGYPRAVYLNSVVFEHMQIGLGAHIYDGSVAPSPNDRLDQQRYIALTPDRERVATRMAKEIRRFKNASNANPIGRIPKVTVFALVPAGQSYEQISKFLCSMTHNPYDAPFIEEFVLFSRRKNFDIAQLPARLRKLIRHEYLAEHDSFGQKVNHIAQNAATDFFLFLDTQSVPAFGFIESCLDVFKDLKIGATGPGWVDPRTYQIHQNGIEFLEHEGQIRPVHLYRGWARKEPLLAKRREVQVLPGNGLMVRRDIFLKLDGFSKATCGSLPWDLVCRIRECGLKAVLNPQASLYCSLSTRLQMPAFFTLTPEQWVQFLKIWSSVIRPSLAGALAEDGFDLCAMDSRFYIAPSSGLMSRLQTNGRHADSEQLNQSAVRSRLFLESAHSAPSSKCEMTAS